MRIGLDIGSTTLKCVVLDNDDNLAFHSYERHFSQISEKTILLLKQVKEMFPEEKEFKICISGSAGMGLAKIYQIPFIQEVYATRLSILKLIPNTDVVVELGGEDAKILFLTNSMEVRMNGSCAGGTGAFIDQMATLLDLNLVDLNDYAKKSEKIYTIASRCGVFAKSDIQPLLNQGARKEDIAASIFVAVVNQTIAGLAQGREINGQIVYLGGPLTFFSELRNSFDKILGVRGLCPENSLYFVAMGAAYSPDSIYKDIDQLILDIQNFRMEANYSTSNPLFKDSEEYNEFYKRHEMERVEYGNPYDYIGDTHLGIDAGSTTIKMVLIDDNEMILHSKYMTNSGNPVPIVKDYLSYIYNEFPNIKIRSSAVTGYGEEIIKNAFKIDFGLVETIAHFTAAKKFKPDVDFIIDIGGQDIKCFKIRNGAIDNIFLNEACSSGCGSFLQTFAGALGYKIGEFAQMGIFADSPVDLGSRCTVFMNSSVKQAQKDGATIENISAGLSMSVVKNALYKVIRVSSYEELGQNIVLQGGTFYNDVVLRAFEKEIKKDVVRPNISGLMGAYGAALYAKSHNNNESNILTTEDLRDFVHNVKAVTCNLCSNSCRLTINTFSGNRKFIGGNRCEKPIRHDDNLLKLNIFDYKLSLLSMYKPIKGKRGSIGIPLVLNMYELLPFWHSFFTSLGFEVVISPTSNRDLYLKGQHTIPSDTVCFPAKLVHGHIEHLIDKGVENIFYPCLSYNLDEGKGDNHYNCPVVAYYPEVINANVLKLKSVKFIYDYIGIHNKRNFEKSIYKVLKEYFKGISFKEIKNASKSAYMEYESYMNKTYDKGREIIELANKNNMEIIVLAGRPYHIDPEVNHGIAKLITEFNIAVVSEDSIGRNLNSIDTNVLNQWTYHGRLYSAAKYIKDKKNMNMIQLVSFGCGLDAITSDEVKEILESEGKIYTQIKIDEITNLGAVKIRIRSLLAALEQGEEVLYGK